MDIPTVGIDCPEPAGVAGVRSHTCPVELPAKSEPKTVEVNRGRLVADARWKRATDLSQAIVEIFQSSGPARRDDNFNARTRSPALAHSQDFVLITGRIGILQETRLRPGEPPGRVEKPVVKGVARPSAKRRDEIELFGDRASRT